MAIYSSNVSVLNAIVAQCMANPMMDSRLFYRQNGQVIQHNPRNNKRTKRSKSKRKGR